MRTRDRYGDRLDDDQVVDVDQPPLHRCTDGWLEPDGDVVRPCPVCRPDTTARLNRQRTRDWTTPGRTTP